MWIATHHPNSVRELATAFKAHRLIYGSGGRYASLVSPASAVLSAAEARDLEEDLGALAHLFRSASQLYLSSRIGQAPAWLADCAEWGLSPLQRQAQILVAQAGLEPMMGRPDYVEITPERRQVAEVQWKSGGPGLLIGHQDAYAEVYDGPPGTARLGTLRSAYLRALQSMVADEEHPVVNEVRREWLTGESELVAGADRCGWRYLPVDRAELGRHVRWSGGRLICADSGGAPVSVLRGRGFTEALPDAFSLALARGSVAGQIWVEAPLSHVYRQKWVLALPFAAETRDAFDDRLRAVLIPTVLILGTEVDLQPLAREEEADFAERLRSVRRVAELGGLPESVRRRLVFKSGAGVGDMQSRGRGVFRLTGSRGAAEKILSFVEGRLNCGEPWVLQPFVDVRHQVPLAVPSAESAEGASCHARTMTFGGRDSDGDWSLHGAIANFSTDWKVSGRSTRVRGNGPPAGSAFLDVRVESDQEEDGACGC